MSQKNNFYCEQDEVNYRRSMKGVKTRCEVCDREINILYLKRHKETYSHFSNAKAKGVPTNFHFLKQPISPNT